MSLTTGGLLTKSETLRALLGSSEQAERIFGRRGELRYNAMAQQLEQGGVRIGLEKADLVDVRIGITRAQMSISGVTTEPSWTDLEATVLSVAQKNAYHPVEEWLTGLLWDKVDRLSGEVPKAFGQPAGGLSATLLRKSLRAMVARALFPACKADTVLVLVGRQGLGKSTAWAALGGEWFTDQPVNVEHKDSFEVCHRYWIIELGELSTLNKSDLEAVKAFVSKCDDTFRLSYDKRAAAHKRRFVMVGTTNHDEFLRDQTGNRRWWPIDISQKIDTEWLKANRDQIFAQAAFEVRNGAQWHLDAAEEVDLDKRNEQHLESDPWEKPIRDWLEKAENAQAIEAGVGLDRILKEACDVPLGRMHTGDAKRAASVMRAAGMKQRRTRRARLWVKDTHHHTRQGALLEAMTHS